MAEIKLPALPATLLPLGPTGCPASSPSSPEAAPCGCSFPSCSCSFPSAQSVGSLLLWRAALSEPAPAQWRTVWGGGGRK